LVRQELVVKLAWKPSCTLKAQNKDGNFSQLLAAIFAD
jgi:hypothetical protein